MYCEQYSYFLIFLISLVLRFLVMGNFSNNADNRLSSLIKKTFFHYDVDDNDDYYCEFFVKNSMGGVV